MVANQIMHRPQYTPNANQGDVNCQSVGDHVRGINNLRANAAGIPDGCGVGGVCGRGVGM